MNENENAVSLFRRFLKVQNELKAPKNRYNSFGKYNYRSCEDILEAAKKVCFDSGLILMLSDEAVSIDTWHYIKASAWVFDAQSGQKFPDNPVTGFAREDADRKGMDKAQITGTASSYARKYALCGLFGIDDTKDGDTDEHTIEKEERKKAAEKTERNAYNAVMAKNREIVNGMKDAESAMAAIQHLKTAEHVLTSRDDSMRLFTQKLNELGLRWDKSTRAVLPT